MKRSLSILALSTLLLASCAKEKQADLPESKTFKGVECVLIKAGSFVMGAPDDYMPEEEAHLNEKPQHNVSLTKDFYLGKYEVTCAQFVEFLNANITRISLEPRVLDYDGVPQRFLVFIETKRNGKQPLMQYISNSVADDSYVGFVYARYNANSNEFVVDEQYQDFPAIGVTWYGADEFCRWAGGKLPTEAQWEYACRAGTTTTYYFGDDDSLLGEYEWFYGNTAIPDGFGNEMHAVGTKKANPWGLYDMLGNATEWCSDWYESDFYVNSPVKNPENKDGRERHVIRGGNINYDPEFCTSTARLGQETNKAYTTDGFRLCVMP